MKLKKTLLVTTTALGVVFGLTTAATAYEGLYGAIGAGLSYMQEDPDFEANSGPLLFDSDADFDNGIGVFSALGYAYGNGWRTELELSYRNNDLRFLSGDGLGFSGFPATTISGDTKTYALMANLIRDVHIFGDGFVPYLGAGVGGAIVDPSFVGSNPGFSGGPATISNNDERTTFAYQGIAGVAIGLAENLALDLSYRYFSTLNGNHSGAFNGSPATFRSEYHNHSVFAGLRWNFGSAGPAPVAVQYKDCWDGSSVPVSTECPAQLVEQSAATPDPIGFTVYFDYDKSNLTPEASNLVAEASARALANDIDTVVVEGNADRSGGSAYNQTLSLRRANIVRDALIANGVPAEMIRSEAYGEENPAKPTADGVREPLNRRSEVTIRFE